jgi:SAM-dependent methyltransferase
MMLVELVKNLAAFLLRPLRERSRKLGIEGDPAVAVAALSRMAPAFSALGVRADGLRVLELGPGRTPELMVATILAGADEAVGVDTSMQVPPDAREPWRYRALLEELGRPENGAVLEALGSSAERAKARYELLADAPLAMSSHEYDGARLPLADGSVDLIISKSVLEHVRLRQIPTLLREMIRVLAPGGGMVHAIDLRDHLHIDGDDRVSGDWLTALRYRRWLFDAMFSQRATSINRLREPQWRSELERAGLEVAYWRTSEFPLPEGFRSDRLQPPWNSLSREILEVGFIHVAARKTV